MGDIDSPSTRKGSSHTTSYSPAGNLAGLTFGMQSINFSSPSNHHAVAPGGFDFSNAPVTMPSQGPSSHAMSPVVNQQNGCHGRMVQAFRPRPLCTTPPLQVSPYTGKGKAKAQEKKTDDMALFTTDKAYPVRRYVYVRSFPKDDASLQLKHWGPHLLHSAVSDKPSNESQVCIYACFDDIRDAITAYEELTTQGEDASQVQYISDTFFSERAELAPHVTSKYDAQVLFVAVIGTHRQARAKDIQDRVNGLALSFGDVLAFAQFDQRSFSDAVEFRVEYAKVSDAREAVSQLTPQTAHFWENYTITAKPFKDVLAQLASESPPAALASPATNSASEEEVHTSPSGRTQWTTGPNGKVTVQQPPVVLPPMAHGAHGASPHSHMTQNYVYGHFPSYDTGMPATNAGNTALARGRHLSDDMDNAKPLDGQGISVDRIANGLDVRTTIMVRNVPHFWSSDDFKNALDETSFGQYDFAYLRMDFAKDHNVGYGFVNFIDAQSIIPFVRKYYKKCWVPGLYPARVGELSYATVQGYDCLVEKFRNSAIMDECPGYRPRLFWSVDNTNDRSLIGTVREFPPPNNLSKKQRSQDNAAQLGLYAPRSGHRVDRARRSNFDRGNSRQIAEEEQQRNYSLAPAPSQAPGGYHGFVPGMMGPVYPHPHMAHMQMQQMGYGYPYPAQFPGYPQQHMAMFPNQMQPGYGYAVNNQASQLRTLSRGQLGGMRRQATIAPPERYDPLPDPVTGIVPRVMQYPNGLPGTNFQPPVQPMQYGGQFGGEQYGGAQYGGAQYDASANGNGNYGASSSFNGGANFGNYSQHNY